MPVWVETNSQMSSDDYRNRIKPFITSKLYQQLSGGELPPADKIVLKNFRITQTGDYSYTIYYNEEELRDKWEELSQHIYVVVDKNSCLIEFSRQFPH